MDLKLDMLSRAGAIGGVSESEGEDITMDEDVDDVEESVVEQSLVGFLFFPP